MPTHHGAGRHHHVATEFGAGQDDHTGAEPAAVADDHRDVVGPLDVDDLVGVLVAVVLVGDVHVGAGLDVAADVDLEVADDVAPPADHGAVADPHHRVGHHRLPRDHAGRQAHVGADQGVLADPDPLLTEDGPGREGQAAALAERTEAVGQTVAGTGGAVADDPVPPGVDERVEPPVAESSEVAGGRAPRVRRPPEATRTVSGGADRHRCAEPAGRGPRVGGRARCAHPATVSDRTPVHAGRDPAGPSVPTMASWATRPPIPRPTAGRRRRPGAGRQDAARAVRLLHRAPRSTSGPAPATPEDSVGHLLATLAIGPGSRVLDIAAGTGKLTRALVATARHVVASEPSASMREVFATIRAGHGPGGCHRRAAAVRRPVVRRRHGGPGVPLVRRPGGPGRVRPGAPSRWRPGPGVERARRVRPGGRRADQDQQVGRAPALPGGDGLRGGHRRQSAPFGPVDRTRFRFTQELDRHAFVEQVASRSYIAVLPDDRRRAILDDVAASGRRRSTSPSPCPTSPTSSAPGWPDPVLSHGLPACPGRSPRGSLWARVPVAVRRPPGPSTSGGHRP